MTKLQEDAIIAIVRLNKAEKKIEVKKEWLIGKLRIVYLWRSKKNAWGRFGGGWNWELGVMLGNKIVIFNLFVFSLRFQVMP